MQKRHVPATASQNTTSQITNVIGDGHADTSQIQIGKAKKT
jgi:hypothetical protein